MEIFPAIDLSGGKVVRLTRGDYDQMTVYGDDPAAVAAEFWRAGARNLHVVDLDGAKDGTTANQQAVRQILAAVDMFVEVGGGIRNEERIRQYLDLGAGRVILGTVAAKDPEFLREMAAKYGDKIAVGIDARGGRVAVSGWLEETELETAEFCRFCRDIGVRTAIVTDIDKDGVLGGANVELYRELTAIEGLDIIASGGVSSQSDLDALAAAGVAGAIIGKALYNGNLDLAECLAGAEAAKC
ncbi:MAG: 1-(5-phosphoribosyl)-5-[Firmicutes bacterium]|nr:1-(5-phosphoribosyl)-5-[(5-phosphoribosylamino)methylideneamino]imidazole-4-carboxamide isomerase [Bacillota bacterium]